MFKNGMQLLAEMAKGETDRSYEDLEAKMANIKFEKLLADIQAVTGNDVVMTKEAVVVRGCSRIDKYLVEMGDLSRYMQDNNMRNFAEAVNDIAECNELDATKFAVVVDEQAIEDMVYEAQCAQKCSNFEYAKEKLEAVVDLQHAWSIMEQQGINIVKFTS